MDASDGEAPLPPHLEGYPEEYLPRISTRRMRIFKYDTKKYPFRDVVVEMFQQANIEEKFWGDENACIEEALNKIHLVKGNNITPKGKNINRTRTNNSPFHKIYSQLTRKHQHDNKSTTHLGIFEKYNHLLDTFCRGVVAGMMEVNEDQLLYQSRPTLRISPPRDKPMGHPHIDYEYHHQPSEINFWIPLNTITGSMSLHVESIPGKKDFRPVETCYGECLMFWGNQCKHYTVANKSGNSRVSLDFRCMERERYNPNFINLKGKPTQFRLGEYYSDTGMAPLSC